MNPIAESRRVKYTKMVIKESLLLLMKTQPIYKITVTDICKRADVNRGTFYLYYKDAYDLLEQIEQELFDEISVIVEKLAKSNSTSKDLLKEIFSIIAENADLCEIIFSKNGDKEFLSNILLLAKEKVLSEWGSVYKSSNREYLDYLYVFTSNGTIGIIQHWLSKRISETPEQISVIVDLITQHCTETIQQFNKLYGYSKSYR